MIARAICQRAHSRCSLLLLLAIRPMTRWLITLAVSSSGPDLDSMSLVAHGSAMLADVLAQTSGGSAALAYVACPAPCPGGLYFGGLHPPWRSWPIVPLRTCAHDMGLFEAREALRSNTAGTGLSIGGEAVQLVLLAV